MLTNSHPLHVSIALLLFADFVDHSTGVERFLVSGNSARFDVSNGYAIEETSAYSSETTANGCRCRRGCKVSLQCHGYSFDPTDTKCLLTSEEKPPLVVRTGAQTISFLEPAADGLYYKIFNQVQVPYAEAVSRCQAIPGYHIAQAKTTLIMDTIRTYYEDLPEWKGCFFIGLVKDSGGYHWEDGSAVDMAIFHPGEPTTNDFSPHFTVYLGELDDGPVDSSFGTSTRPTSMGWTGDNGYLCQPNFHVVDLVMGRITPFAENPQNIQHPHPQFASSLISELFGNLPSK